MPFLSRGYLDAKGSAIHLEDLSLAEILLDRRVSGEVEGEVRVTGDVRFPTGLNGRGSCGPPTDPWNLNSLLPGFTPFLSSPSALPSSFKKECFP